MKKTWLSTYFAKCDDASLYIVHHRSSHSNGKISKQRCRSQMLTGIVYQKPDSKGKSKMSLTYLQYAISSPSCRLKIWRDCTRYSKHFNCYSNSFCYGMILINLPFQNLSTFVTFSWSKIHNLKGPSKTFERFNRAHYEIYQFFRHEHWAKCFVVSADFQIIRTYKQN